MKKIRVVILFLLLLTTLCSCFGENELEKSFNKLSESNYTMTGSMRIDLSMSYAGQTQQQTLVADMLIEASQNESYTVSTINGQSQYSYVKLNEENVDVYTKSSGSWSHEVQSLEEYKEESDSFFLDIEVKDVFELKDGVWVGNTEMLTTMLEKYMDTISEDLVGASVTINSFNVEKYDIVMEGNEISEIEVIMTLDMSSSGVSLSMKMTLPMEVSKIGETVVTVPEGINNTK